ncbi:hypothetical protein K3495_g7415 [Podosphaera aphanis]|nr:hypothetical protein K3495_g7415 [Podosphaera aphanis]
MPLYGRLATIIISGRVRFVNRAPDLRYYLHTSAVKASQGYGDPVGSPKGENPLQQGSQSTATHSAEHPGPTPPPEGRGHKTGQKQGKSQKTPEDASAKSGGSRSMMAEETGSSPTGGEIRSATGTATKVDDSVEKHNKEFAEGYDRAPKTDAGKNLRE